MFRTKMIASYWGFLSLSIIIYIKLFKFANILLNDWNFLLHRGGSACHTHIEVKLCAKAALSPFEKRMGRGSLTRVIGGTSNGQRQLRNAFLASWANSQHKLETGAGICARNIIVISHCFVKKGLSSRENFLALNISQINIRRAILEYER